jgi:hypothetical protein
MAAPAIPVVTNTIADGGLGIVPSGSEDITILVGTSSAGSAANFYSYAGSDTTTVTTDLGSGPLVKQTVKHLIRSKGKQVIAYKVAPTTPGAVGSITQSGAGPVISVSSGTPNDQYDMQIVIVTGGARGTATFQYTMDGGDNWSAVLTTAATVALDDGVTYAMASGTYVADETYTWTDTAPIMTSSDVSTALDAIIASPYRARRVHILGQQASAANAHTVATMLGTKVDAAHLVAKYLYCIFEAPALDKAGLITEFASFEHKFVLGCAGFAEVVEDSGGRQQKRSAGRCIVPRIARNPIAVHALRNEADSTIDPLTDVAELVPSGAAASTGYHDEDATPGLNAARFATLRTITGQSGFYVTNTPLFSGLSSDFQQHMHAEIMLKTVEVWHAFATTQLARRVRKNPSTGYIASAFASALEREGEQTISAALGDAIEGVRVIVNRTDDLTADPTLRAKVRIVIGSYAQEMETEIGFAPALNEAA